MLRTKKAIEIGNEEERERVYERILLRMPTCHRDSQLVELGLSGSNFDFGSGFDFDSGLQASAKHTSICADARATMMQSQ
jgi:hypothetical protein